MDTEYSVSGLSAAIKTTIEGAFGRVRVRGELSRSTTAKSGHFYTTLKDENAVLDAVCWKGTFAKLPLTPVEGMAVICTGRLTTYAGKSSYQLVIEHMELAGVGALLKLIEDRRIKLAGEGLFDADRKKELPFLPHRIGVITSPTGAVIRDILHRLSDRFPLPVTLWPVVVQGAQTASECIAAINGFNAMTGDARPAIIILARGGGSVEDLMPFNDESLVQAVAGSDIPIISAIGHETDTTLCDYAADLRVPTPTAAAEHAVPVRRDVWAFVQDCGARSNSALSRLLDTARNRLVLTARLLSNPARLFENPTQRLDRVTLKLDQALKNHIAHASGKLARLHRIPNPQTTITNAHANLATLVARLPIAFNACAERRAVRLESATRLLETLSYRGTLQRGFAVIKQMGKPVTRAANFADATPTTITFYDGDQVIAQ